MASVYPGSTITAATLPPVTDNVTPVMAGQINPVYLEVIAIEETLGALASTYAASTSAYTNAPTTFASVSARIGNLEKGLNSRMVDTIGGSVIQPAVNTTVPLTIKQYTGASVNLLEFKNASGTVVNAINSSGNITTIDGGDA